MNDVWQKDVPAQASALKEEAKALIERHDYHGAIMKLEQSLAFKQDYYLAVYNLALAYALRGTDAQAPSESDRKRAWHALERAQRIAEAQGIHDAVLYTTMGWLATMEAIFSQPEEFSQRTAWYDAAQRYWESALNIDVASAGALHNLGALYALRGDSERAVEYYAKAEALSSATDSGRTQTEAAATGAGIGAILCGVPAAILGNEKLAISLAAACGAVGGAAGYGVGTVIGNKKAEYASREAYLDAMLQRIRATNEILQQTNMRWAQDIRKYQAETIQLMREYRQDKRRYRAVQAKYQEMEGELSKRRKMLEWAKERVNIEKAELQNVRGQLRSAQEQNLLDIRMNPEIRQLENDRDELEQWLREFESTKDQLHM